MIESWYRWQQRDETKSVVIDPEFSPEVFRKMNPYAEYAARYFIPIYETNPDGTPDFSQKKIWCLSERMGRKVLQFLEEARNK